MPIMRFLFVLFAFAFQFSCSEDVPYVPITDKFRINVANTGPITFYNPECDFNNSQKNQSQYNVANSYGFFLLSTYWNSNPVDHKTNQIWIELDMYSTSSQNKLNIDSLASILIHESNSNNNERLKIAIMVEVDGKKYYNRFLGDEDDYMLFQIEEYELPYYSDCLKRDLLYLKLKFEGPFYSYDVVTRTDSIKINESELELLFAAD